MYYLAIQIENRKYHILPLRNEPEPRQPIPSFVLQAQPGGAAKTIVSLWQETKLIYHGGTAYDRFIDWSALAIESIQDGVVVRLATSTTEPPPVKSIPTLTDGGLVLDFSDRKCTLKASGSSVRLVFVAEIEGREYQGEIRCHLAPEKQIFDVVMDFGSEASQLVVRQRTSPNLEAMNVVENLTQYFYSHLKGKRVHQQEPGNNDLYKSAFFVKKEGVVFLPNNPPGTAGINGNEEFLNLLTDYDLINDLLKDRVLVSNLKLAHLRAYEFKVQFKSLAENVFKVQEKTFGDTIVKLQQAVIHYFLQAVLEQIKRSTRADAPIYLAVKLLMPNVFEQATVTRIINGTAEALHQKLTADPQGRFRGFEVGTISESDAAFLGFKYEQSQPGKKQASLKPGGRYLIIDVGKGTTDFSIIELLNNHRAISTYRSGFVGAGNILTYAFIDTVFAALFGTDTVRRQQAILNVFGRAGVAGHLPFLAAIEQLKQNFKLNGNHPNLSQDSEVATIRKMLADPNEVGVLDAITNLVNKVAGPTGGLADEFGIIGRTVEALSERILEQVTYSGQFRDPESGKTKLDQVILTGRGFLFDPFFEAIAALFKQYGVGVVRANAGPMMKKICLKGAFGQTSMNYESNVVGYPFRYGAFQEIASLPGGSSTTGAGAIWDRFGNTKNWLSSFEQTINSAATLPTQNQSIQTVLDNEEKRLIQGHDLGTLTDNDVISICGISFQHHLNGSLNVFYTGDGFIARNDQQSNPLTIHPTFRQKTPWEFKTLFPFLPMPVASAIVVEELTNDTDEF
jgi:hypothetical protein